MPRSLLRMLVEADNEYVSGQQLSRGLGVTRAAVWKKISVLRDSGFLIDAVPSRGYRLERAPALSAEYLELCLGSTIWKRILSFSSLDSTNETAMSLCAGEGEPEGTVVVADRQKKGRGRRGRTWESPAKTNLYLSMVLRPRILPREAPVLTLLAAVAAASALTDAGAPEVLIKWPNDLLIREKKVGGILTEIRADPESVTCAVIGIGINVNIASKSFPPEISEAATSLMIETGIRFDRNELLLALLRSFDHWYRIFRSSGRYPILDEWRRRSATLGRNVVAAFDSGEIRGVAEDIDDSGMLVLRLPDNTKRLVAAGDIQHLRRAAG